jgi:type IV fimbrial biogenesis protein FimT
MNHRGLTLIEMLVAIVVMGMLLAIAIPSFGNMKMAMAFRSAEQEVLGLMARARWSAITSGRPTTTIWLEGSALRVRAGALESDPIVASVDVSEFNAAITEANNLPARFSSRGFRLNTADAVPRITLANPRISATRDFTVGPLGKTT